MTRHSGKDIRQELDSRDELVENLVRLAAEGPEVPADGAEKVKAAIRPAWKAEVRRRKRKIVFAWSAATLAAAACLVLAVSTFIDPTPPVVAATVAHVQGSPQIVESTIPFLRGKSEAQRSEILAGSWLRTDTEQRVALNLEGGASLRIDQATRVRMLSATEIHLDQGAVYLDSEASGQVVVSTDMGAVREIGTQFSVRRHADELLVMVREGKVVLSQETEQTVVAKGHMATATGGGRPRIEAVDPWASNWDWVQDVAPPFDIEGAKLGDYLRWVSRETGWVITSSTPEVARSFETIVLHGSIDGSSVIGSLDLVLPGCDLVGVREGPSDLVIATATDQPESLDS